MREIKFRGQRVDNGKWFYGYPIKQFGVLKIYQDQETKDFGEWIYEVKPETIGQYTGLKDNNDKEIYEGDMVQYKNSIEHGIGEVVFDNCGFEFNWLDRNEFPTSMKYLMCSSELEIIGNIYENPELLEVRNED